MTPQERIVDPRRRRRARIGLLAMSVLIALSAAVISIVLLGPTGNQPNTGAPGQSPADMSVTPSAPSTTNTAPEPGELETLEASLASGDDGSVAQFLPLGQNESPDPTFVSTVQRMNLKIDRSSLKSLAHDAWEVAARGADGVTWHIGLIRSSTGNLTIIYAEAAK